MQNSIHRFVLSFAVSLSVCVALCIPRAQAQTEKIIYSFTGSTDGNAPEGGLLIDSGGNLYGVTEAGGSAGGGTVYELSPGSSGTWTKTVLYSFNFSVGDVYLPTSNLVSDAKGNLYGLAPLGGTVGSGGIFELSLGSNGTWTEKVIYSFGGGTDTVSFNSALANDSAGNLFGYLAPSASNAYGSIFKIQPQANGTWTETIVHTFTGGNDGSAPYEGRLSTDSAGNVYGEAYNGGRDFGIVFEFVRGSNGSWSKKTLHTFMGATDGNAVIPGGLVIDASGNVFGGSQWNVFELVPDSNGSWTEKILHTFSGGSDGAYPDSGPTLSASGTVYGTTYEGGRHFGTVYELKPGSNGTWSEKVLHRFTNTGGDGIYPIYPLVVDTHGDLFGITSSGGISNNGVVFEVTP